MSEKAPKKRSPETLAKWYRNYNAIGAVAFAGAAVAFPAFGGVLLAGAGINAAQAAGGELVRRNRAKKKKQ